MPPTENFALRAIPRPGPRRGVQGHCRGWPMASERILARSRPHPGWEPSGRAVPCEVAALVPFPYAADFPNLRHCAGGATG